ncbi:MAG TPA: hypothetical protein VGH53_10135 [Streptosporangiaceae bacterium]
MRIQPLSGGGEVKPGHTATFVIWVWSTKATSRAVSVRASTRGGRYVGAPTFTVCPDPKGARCPVGNLPVGQATELRASVPVRSTATVGGHVRISADAIASGARSFSGTASDVVVAANATIPSSPTISLPPGTSLPAISGTGVSPTNPSGLFPTVQASPTPSTGSPVLPSPKPRAVLRAADAASTVPVDARLIGGQLAGLAVLAGAVTIAIARLSLRAPKPQDTTNATPSKS